MDNNELPKHMPVDMAFAPDQKPYDHARAIHATKRSTDENRLAQHSLSPEKLGVVGYVKDVAGFVKDVVHERREKKSLARRNSTSSTGSVERRRRPRRSSSSVAEDRIRQQQPQQHSLLADAVTGLFPGISHNDVGCTHAEELRHQMMHINEQHENSIHNNKLL
ncbi:MAG: hypothetical protein EXX96DRAFT_483352 [Benjaminiella poitrasii]|nr:MAG: hypothetical protein EXX96DRAFT_483352 [Benjaminiella poitrasii]